MKSRIKIIIDDYMDEVTAGSHTIIGSFTDEDDVQHSITLLSNNNFERYTEDLFYNRNLPIIFDEDNETLAESVTRCFGLKWMSFLEENAHNFNRIAEALYTEYNPLYNYNKMQHTVNTRTGSESDTGSKIYGQSENTLTKTGTDQLQTAYGATSETLTKSGKDTLTSNYGATSDTLTKSGKETDTRNYGATSDTLTKSGKETDTRNYGATSDTLTKSGKDTLTSNYGATEKNTTENGTITDTHNIGQKQTISEVATMDTNTYQPTGRVTEAARVDSDARSYTGHNVKETDNSHVNTEEKTFTAYQEATAGAARTDTEERTFTNYQEQTAGAARTDTATHSFNNYQERNIGSSRTDTDQSQHVYNSVKDDFTDETKGNIGVMESVTMIESELRLRAREIGRELLQRFYDDYTYAL